MRALLPLSPLRAALPRQCPCSFVELIHSHLQCRSCALPGLMKKATWSFSSDAVNIGVLGRVYTVQQLLSIPSLPQVPSLYGDRQKRRSRDGRADDSWSWKMYSILERR